METSKKLIIIRLIVILFILFFIGTFIFLIIKIDLMGNLFNIDSKTSKFTKSSIMKNLNELNDREFKKIDSVSFETQKEEKQKTNRSIYKYLNNEKNNNDIIIDNKINEETKIKINEIQKLYDKGNYEKDIWVIIDEDLDGLGFNYYFDSNGKLIYNTVSPDYRVVDKYGREVDDDLEPIIYEIKNIENEYISSNSNIISKYSYVSNQTIIGKGAIIKEKSKFYDNQMNRNVIDYIESSSRFKKATNGTIYSGNKWRQVSSLRNDGGFVIFNNPNNNFNKVIGKITTEYTSKNLKTNMILYVYDADLYELYRGYEYMIEPLYETSAFNNNEPLNFSFSFFRTVKRIIFFVKSDDERNHICYLKDLKFGFNNQKYKEELEAAKENEEYINYLKELGIYKTDEEILLELRLLEEDNQSDYLEYEDFNDIDLIDLENDYDRQQRIIDKRTGPAFDEYLRNLKNYWEIEYGPGYYKK